MPDLELQLRDLGDVIAWPEPADDLADRVLAALPPRRPALVRRPLLAAAAVLVIVLLVTVAMPRPREVLADWLGVAAVRITLGGEPDPEVPVGSRLDLGTRTGLDDLPFPVGRPAALGLPDEVWRHGDAEVSLVWRTTQGPVVLTALLSGSAGLAKQSSGASVVAVDVAGEPGYWIEGDHVVRRGNEPSVAAGNVLLWEADGLTYRLEGDLSLDRALAVASSLR